MGWWNKRQSNSSYVFAKRQNVVLDDYGMSFVINAGIMASISRLLKIKYTDNWWNLTENMVADVLGQDHLWVIIEQVEEMLRMTY